METHQAGRGERQLRGRQLHGETSAYAAEPGQLMIDVAQKPQMLRQSERFSPTSPAMADVVSIGLRRLARRGPGAGAQSARRLRPPLCVFARGKVAIARQIGLTLAKRFDSRALKVMAEYDPELRDNTVTEWRTRLLLRGASGMKRTG